MAKFDSAVTALPVDHLTAVYLLEWCEPPGLDDCHDCDCTYGYDHGYGYGDAAAAAGRLENVRRTLETLKLCIRSIFVPNKHLLTIIRCSRSNSGIMF